MPVDIQNVSDQRAFCLINSPNEDVCASLSASYQSSLEPCYKSLSPAICRTSSPFSAGSGLKLDAHGPGQSQGRPTGAEHGGSLHPPSDFSRQMATKTTTHPRAHAVSRTCLKSWNNSLPVSNFLCTWFNIPTDTCLWSLSVPSSNLWSFLVKQRRKNAVKGGELVKAITVNQRPGQ